MRPADRGRGSGRAALVVVAVVAMMLVGLPGSPAAASASSGPSTYTSTDVPKFTTDDVTATSVLQVPDDLPVADLNVVNISLSHGWAGDLDASLTSPAGTTVQLWAGSTCQGDTWESSNTGFDLDDEASSAFGSTCPPGSASYRPSGALSIFDGEESGGTWTFTLNDFPGNSDGALEGWGLQIDFREFVVTSTGDGGDANAADRVCADGGGSCTLRAAIQQANASAGEDRIEFNIPGSGVKTIAPSSALPTITEAVTIDGYTQPGASPNTLSQGNNATLLIELAGTSAGTPADGLEIGTGADETVVRGLVINRFAGFGIEILGSDLHTVQGNFLGTNALGTAALGNVGGVSMDHASGSVVGGTAAGDRNLVSGNSSFGIRISSFSVGSGSLENGVKGNYIGTNAAGTAAVANGDGVEILDAHATTVGGTAAGDRNVISGNSSTGITIEDGKRNAVLGNYIGTNATGTWTLGMGNGSDGLRIEDSAETEVGSSAGNVISGNGRAGVLIFGSRADGSEIEGNVIGTDAALTSPGVALGNHGSGVQIADEAGFATVRGNTIVGNWQHGVHVDHADGTEIQANNIGNIPGESFRSGNVQAGVLIEDSSDTLVGGPFAGDGNLIVDNGQSGVDVLSSGSGNTIRHNRIRDNGLLGIDLRSSSGGVTPNDSADADTGPNGLQNFPVITALHETATRTSFEGTLQSAPNTTYTIDVYSNTNATKAPWSGEPTPCDRSGFGEGAILLFSFDVTTDASGDALFVETRRLTGPGYVTATATDPAGNTSEFSRCFPVPPLVVDSTGDDPDAFTGDGVCDAPGTAQCTLRAAIQQANAQPGKDRIEFAIGSGSQTIAPTSALPAVTEPVVIDATTQPGFSGNPLIELTGAGLGSSADGLRINGGGSVVRGLRIKEFLDAIELTGSGGNVIEGNHLFSSSKGLNVLNSSGNTIGGRTAAAGNAVSGNGDGIVIAGPSATGNLIRGNQIGEVVNVIAPPQNLNHGVLITMGASGNTIGGSGAGAGNVISFNGDRGVFVASGERNTIWRNSIFSNGGMGIDLSPAGVTPNDPGDDDTGTNGRQNFPVLGSALQGGSGTTITGTLDGVADTTYRVELFSSQLCDTTSNGEGQTYRGAVNVTTDDDGMASFTKAVPTIPTGHQVTATATDPAGNTSEFGACRAVAPPPSLAIDDVTVTEGSSGTTNAVFTVNRSGNLSTTSTVAFATANNTAVQPADYASASGTLTFVPGDASETITVQVAGDAMDEVDETFRVNLSSPTNASITDAQGVGTITDDDPEPQVSVNDVSVTEGASGEKPKATFKISLSAPSGKTVSVQYATAHGTTNNNDYTPRSLATLSFGPGVTSRNVDVTILGDALVEPDETFFFNLSSPTNATIADGQGVGTIQNDD